MNISAKPFGRMPDGKLANLYTLSAGSGLKLEMTDYGGCMVFEPSLCISVDKKISLC